MTSAFTDWQWSYDGWIIVVTSLVAVVCAIPGSFLLIRRQAMVGDAVAHAVLPGIAIGFLVSGSRGGGWMLLGAIVAGLLTAVLTQTLKSIGGVDRGAALGVVFSTLFSLGLVLIVRTADTVDLDPACVLYGQVELVPLDLVRILDLNLPSVVITLGAVLAAMIAVTGLLWKELLIASFDKETSDTQGIPASVLNQILMVLVAVSCVVAFEAVGSILVVALLIGPPAAARLLTDRLLVMVWVAAMLGVVSCVVGHFLAASIIPGFLEPERSVSTSGTIAVMATALVGVGGIRWLASE